MPPGSPPTYAEAIAALHQTYFAIRGMLRERLGKKTRKRLEKLRDMLADVLIRVDGRGND